MYRITGAPSSRSSDLDRRVTRYLISMAVRTACVILVFVIPGPAKWVFGAGAVFLPYVAVLFANASGGRGDAGPAPIDHRGLSAAPASPSPAQPPAGSVLRGQVVRPRQGPEFTTPGTVPGPVGDG